MSSALGHRHSVTPRDFQRLSFAKLVFLAGASRTVLQTEGKSASIMGFGGFDGLEGVCGCSTLSENQKSRSLAPQPSSPRTGAWAWQFGELDGHFRRTWIWSWCLYQGRTFASHA